MTAEVRLLAQAHETFPRSREIARSTSLHFALGSALERFNLHRHWALQRKVRGATPEVKGASLLGQRVTIFKQYDVSDPAHPREVSSVRLGGIVSRAARPAAPAQRLAGAPQMVEISRDGRRIYLTNSLYGAWDDQFYPDGLGAWMARIDADPTTGGLTIDPGFFPHSDDFRGRRVHQVRLAGGDASSDSYCYRR